MALNKFMHERNPFKEKRPDFKALALKYERFRAVASTDLRGAVQLDFHKPECLRELTWALLKQHYDLDVDLPLDRLIPTIPLRLNYILWLEDILDLNPVREDKASDSRVVRGVDVGTGASCVYPLIAASKNHWHFLATEADEMNFTYATHNVKRNQLQDQITVLKTQPKQILDAEVAAALGDQQLDFCMCNPPFFATNLEAWGLTSRSEDRPAPRSHSSACASESVFSGGEVEFVRHLIADSLKLTTKLRVYTTMLGKKTSVNILKEDLKRNQILHFGTTEFCQGRTMRWGLAWSYDPSFVFPKSCKSQVKGVRSQCYAVPTPLTQARHVVCDVPGVAAYVQVLFSQLQLGVEKQTALSSKWAWRITAYKNTWSHQRRKRRQQQLETSPEKKAHVAPQKLSFETENQSTVDSNNTVVNSCDNTQVTENPIYSQEQPYQTSNTNSDISKSVITQNTSYKSRIKDGTCNKSPSEILDCDVTKKDKDGDSACLLCCDVSVSYDQAAVVVRMDWVRGTEREAMQQVLQYVKNRLR